MPELDGWARQLLKATSALAICYVADILFAIG